ncbi:natterin-3-like [Centroberyx affinis]|uniref:natterin-3-like n=1 Tax=Centroberyx affinis TaxID=166261 RepID=UPI003A5C0791
MKLSVLVLLTLLGLSSASLQEIVKKSSQHRKVSLLDPNLEGRVPKLTGNISVSSPLTPAEFEEQLEQPSSIMFDDTVNLEWLMWPGSLPNGAVSFYNGYTERTDYVCKYKCESGFYNPSLGPHCRYPYGGKEYHASSFEILVNKDNFEFLEWKEDSYGSVPKQSVRTCPGGDVYVGKNEYGLGKVVSRFEAFFLPFDGKEYWYKNYQVLTINKDATGQHISDIKYAIDEAEILQEPPETMRISKVTNNHCQSVVKKVTISKTTEVRKTWNIGRATTLSFKTSVTTEIPYIGSTGIEFGTETTMEFSEGTTKVDKLSHSVTVELTVPPNHSCSVRMEGRKFKTDIPYTARLSRTYRNGETRWTSITGTYDGVEIGEVRAVVNRCEPVPDAQPCP